MSIPARGQRLGVAALLMTMLAMGDASCTQQSGGSGCPPNQQVSCPCPVGGMGIQTCAADGSGFTACSCSTGTGGAGGVSTTATATTGTGGSGGTTTSSVTTTAGTGGTGGAASSSSSSGSGGAGTGGAASSSSASGSGGAGTGGATASSSSSGSGGAGTGGATASSSSSGGMCAKPCAAAGDCTASLMTPCNDYCRDWTCEASCCVEGAPHFFPHPGMQLTQVCGDPGDPSVAGTCVACNGDGDCAPWINGCEQNYCVAHTCAMGPSCGHAGCFWPAGFGTCQWTAAGGVSGNPPPASVPACLGIPGGCGGADLTSDPQNCGACGHDCLGGACTASQCQAIVLASTEVAPQAVVVDATNVYWTDDWNSGHVKKCAIAGCNNQPTTLGSTGDIPVALAVSATDVYWTTNNIAGMFDQGTVLKSPIAGGATTTVAAGQKLPGGIVVQGAFVYWVATGTFAASFTDGSLMKAPLAGGNPVLVAPLQKALGGLAVDATTLYVAVTGGVLKYPLAGGNPVKIGGDLDSPVQIAIDATNLYAADTAKDGVYRVPLAGGASSLLSIAPNFGGRGLAVDATTVYWMYGGPVAPAPVGVRQTPIGGGTTSLFFGTPLGFGWGIATDCAAVYWAQAGKVWKKAK